MLFKPMLTFYRINTIGKTYIGKPRKRWVNIVEVDHREILKVRNCER
jgi:hypothetical protein